MAFKKQLPIRVTLTEELYNLLLDGLKGNEDDFGGPYADDAKALREKIEKYGRHKTDENGDEVVSLGFYEREGEKFIFQFIAASRIAADYRELLKFTDKFFEDKK